MNKEFTATQKFLIMSPRKLRLVAALIKKMKPVDAVERLPFTGKRASEALGKVIKTALANAKSQGVGETDLVFKEIQIGEGPRLKRGRAASRGRWHPFKKRMSHIRVVLTTLADQKSKIKNQNEKKAEEAVKIEKEGEKSGTKS